MNRKTINIIAFCFMSAGVILGAVFFKSRFYPYLAAAAVLICCVIFFFTAESREHSSRKLVMVAALAAVAVAGRWLCAFLPHFKPFSAVVIICGLCLGAESGFLCGAVYALASNFIFGQGAWTPFQMLAMGMTGFLSGIIKPLRNSRTFLLIFSAACGMLYSFVMDIWTVLWADNAFNAERFLAVAFTSLGVTFIYMASNVLFLLLFKKPFVRIIERIKLKYGM